MVILEGVAFPLDVLNKNGWGIPSSDADNAISSLKNAVVRVCSRDAPHGCDISEDPKAEIGRVLAAWNDNGIVRTRVEITDSVANQKLMDRTWPMKWSVYGKSKTKNNGWTEGANIRSITLVTNPAWDDATFNIAASEDGENKLHFFNDFSISAPVVDTMTEQNNTPPGGTSPAELEAKLKEQQGIIEALTKDKTELTSQIEALNTQLGELKTVAASKDAELAKRITLEEAQKLVASAIAADHEKQAKDAILAKLVAARETRGLAPKTEELQVLTAAQLQSALDDLEAIDLSASTQVKYQANNGNGSRLKIYDPLQRLGPNGGF